MIKSTVKVFQDFPRITALIEARTIEACDAAAEAGVAVARERAAGVSDVEIVPTRPTVNGYASGIKFEKFIWRFFDKGTLGKHVGKLKRNRRETWTVNRDNPYVAHRGDIQGKGIAPRRISSPARTAGRRALIARLRGTA